MIRYLLDVNVLVALFDPRHLYHELAHQWWSSVGKDSWASSSTTENGFIRVVSSPAYPALDLMPNQAIRVFADFLKKQKSHKFWPEDLSLSDISVFDPDYVTGHRQITDVYLLGLAKHYNGRLATFDRKIEHRAIVGGSGKLLEVIQ